jgi:hypothetical protein
MHREFMGWRLEALVRLIMLLIVIAAGIIRIAAFNAMMEVKAAMIKRMLEQRPPPNKRRKQHKRRIQKERRDGVRN